MILKGLLVLLMFAVSVLLLTAELVKTPTTTFIRNETVRNLRAPLITVLVALALVLWVFNPGSFAAIIGVLSWLALILFVGPPIIELVMNATVEHKTGEGSDAERKRLVKVLVAFALIASALTLNSCSPTEKEVLARIEEGISLDAFLRDYTEFGNTYFVFNAWHQMQPYDPSIRNARGTVKRGEISASTLEGLQDLIREGGLDSSTFTGTLVLRRSRWFHGNAAIYLTFVNGKLAQKSLGEVSFGSIQLPERRMCDGVQQASVNASVSLEFLLAFTAKSKTYALLGAALP